MTKMSNFHAPDAKGRAYLDPQRAFERFQRQKNRVAELKLLVKAAADFAKSRGSR